MNIQNYETLQISFSHKDGFASNIFSIPAQLSDKAVKVIEEFISKMEEVEHGN